MVATVSIRVHPRNSRSGVNDAFLPSRQEIYSDVVVKVIRTSLCAPVSMDLGP